MPSDMKTTQRASAYLVKRSVESAREASLVIILGEPFGKAFAVSTDPITIGRSSSCDIQFGQDSISRMHCKVWLANEKYHIEDMGSTNRTLVNGREISKHILSDGDRITVGETVLKFVMEGSAEAHYHAELYARATEDPLTGIANRRLFEEILAREVDACIRHQQPLSLMVLDIDNFKDVNDAYDHLVGDAALRSLSDLLRGCLSAMETVARLGGEEFGVIMPGKDLQEAAQVAEQIRADVSRTSMHCEGIDLKLTVSIGVAEFSPPMHDGWDLFKRADRELIRAKTKGRNRVSIAR